MYVCVCQNAKDMDIRAWMAWSSQMDDVKLVQICGRKGRIFDSYVGDDKTSRRARNLEHCARTTDEPNRVWKTSWEGRRDVCIEAGKENI